MLILIIEDEIPAATRIRKLVEAHFPEAFIPDAIDSVEDAVSLLTDGKSPDLIFMDIHLADGLSFNIFDRVKVKSPVIFTTAFDQYAIQAFKVNSIDYLLKPVDEDELAKAVAKYKEQRNQAGPDIAELARALRQQVTEPGKRRFLVKEGTKLRYVKVDDVAFFFSENSISFLCTNAGHRFMLDPTLDDLELSVSDSSFFRINRKMLVSLNCISQIEPYPGNRLALEVQPAFDEGVIVSRQKVSSFKKWIDS